jgi:phosphoribosylanthranilate isomerase
MIVQIYEVTTPAEARALGVMGVQDVIRVTRPAGVDFKSKTDKNDGTHTKDLQKMSAFVTAARSANSRII